MSNLLSFVVGSCVDHTDGEFGGQNVCVHMCVCLGGGVRFVFKVSGILGLG